MNAVAWKLFGVSGSIFAHENVPGGSLHPQMLYTEVRVLKAITSGQIKEASRTLTSCLYNQSSEPWERGFCAL